MHVSSIGNIETAKEEFGAPRWAGVELAERWLTWFNRHVSRWRMYDSDTLLSTQVVNQPLRVEGIVVPKDVCEGSTITVGKGFRPRTGISLSVDRTLRHVRGRAGFLT